MELSGRVVVLTGAAHGIGRALLAGFVGEGCRIAAIDQRWDEPDNDLKEWLSRGTVRTLTAAITSDADLAQARGTVEDAFGTVDVIVNNAAMRMRNVNPATYSPILETAIAHWQAMFDTNVVGPVRVIQAFAPALVEKQAGSIINISSSSGVLGRPGDQPYGASKAALTNLTQSLAAELAPHRIAVNAVMPAMTRTTGYAEQRRARRELLGPLPSALPWKPESVTPLVLFLAKQDARLTGRLISVRDWNLEHGLGGDDVWGVPDTAAP